MKYKVLNGLFVLVIIFLVIINLLPRENESLQMKNNYKKGNFSNRLSMMLENEDGEYVSTRAEEWPTTGYKFNSKLSKCANGGKVSWDYKNKLVKMEGASSDKYFIYFDKIVTVDSYCDSGDNLADCIKSYGDQGYDKSSIYIHDSNLTNGAGDNFYRFAGASDYVNNFVCFGSDAITCPTDNLYRIIGVFEDQVKLIKYDYATSDLLGTDGDYNGSGTITHALTYKGFLTEEYVYGWNNTRSNAWSTSLLNKTNLNKNFLNNIGNEWSSMISSHNWQVGGNTWENIGSSPIYTAYQKELIEPATSSLVSSKVGLLYISDYGYASSSKYWTVSAVGSKKVVDENWMYMGETEWLITPLSETTNRVFRIDFNGTIHTDNGFTSNSFSIRPTFYLKSSINYTSGKGTKENPIRLEAISFSEYIKDQYTGTQGSNGIYFHDGTIKSGTTVNDANDGSYRYAGAYETVNNYVCFGSDASTCPTDNLYRIIGVFGDKVKLIKSEHVGSNLLGTNGAYINTSGNYEVYIGDSTSYSWYRWNNETNTNKWSESNLNTVNLNTNFINNIGSNWASKISQHSWIVGGNTYSNILSTSINNVYKYEIMNPATNDHYTAKIGLMYASDFGYAAIPTYWTNNLFSNNTTGGYSAARSSNWIWNGEYQWVLTRASEYEDRVFYVNRYGELYLNEGVGIYESGLRPCFYLNSNVTYAGGEGTKTSPYKLS